MIVLFSDFGLEGPYIGQVKAVLHRGAPAVPVIDLFADAPAYDPKLSAYLLAAYAEAFPSGAVFLAVVDPGVGSDRPCVALQAGGRWFVGPGNGLFEIVARRSEAAGEPLAWWGLERIPEAASASFHGRDVFAPAAARLAATGGVPEGWLRQEAGIARRPDWPDDLERVVYIDVFGNVLTGIRAATLSTDDELSIGGKTLRWARTFSDVSPGEGLWYENSNGLAEVAVNRGRASDLGRARIGEKVTVTRKGK